MREQIDPETYVTIQKMIKPVQPNTQAPPFTLYDQDNKAHSLSDYRGHWVLLYFYPKDDTPGCTTQACGLRDYSEKYKQANIVVLGISKDSVKSHKKFQEKYGLPFTLLSDSTTEIAQQYGVWGPKKFMGKEFLGMHRISFLIDPNGIIIRVYEKVNVLSHAQQILEDINILK